MHSHTYTRKHTAELWINTKTQGPLGLHQSSNYPYIYTCTSWKIELILSLDITAVIPVGMVFKTSFVQCEFKFFLTHLQHLEYSCHPLNYFNSRVMQFHTHICLY